MEEEKKFIPGKQIEQIKEEFQKEQLKNLEIPPEEALKRTLERLHNENNSLSDDSAIKKPFPIKKEEIEEETIRLKPETHDKQISELIRIFNEKGPLFAISVVKKIANPHLTDDFHRKLVDELIDAH